MTTVSSGVTSVDSEAEARRRAYRDVVGHLATGVTVVTWHDGERVRGLTANAVTSLSLEPLLMLACIDRKSTAHEQLATVETFAINILAESQQSVSNAFARHAHEEILRTPFVEGSTGAPLIDGSLAWLECRVRDRLDGGDHTIYIGEVIDMGTSEAVSAPLLFFRGKYGQLATEMGRGERA